LFVDKNKIAALYDAVLRPDRLEGKTTIGKKSSNELGGEAGVTANLEVGMLDWLQKVFPFLSGKASAGASGKVQGKQGDEDSSVTEFFAIETPQRQLLQLALHYHYNLPDRLRFVTDLRTQTDWLEKDFISKLPKGLVFVDFPPLTIFVPMAAEVQGAGVMTIYPDLIQRFVGPRERDKVPRYPEPAYYKEGDEAKLAEDRQKYWTFFKTYFSSTVSMEAVEEAARKGDRIRWIAYRLPIDEKRCLHLDVDANGEYDAGVFAYRFIKRGYKHGLRMVGIMKSEPDMNVLAVFEK